MSFLTVSTLRCSKHVPLAAVWSATRASTCAFSHSARVLANSTPVRALVFSKYGDPAQVLKASTFDPLPPPSNSQVVLKILLAPINPADLNVVEGVYPSKPSFRSRTTLQPISGLSEDGIYFGGNEGLAEVIEVGKDVKDLKNGDRVIFDTNQSGTWASHQLASPRDLIKINSGISQVHGATMRINPPTALGMLRSFVALSAGEFIIQNGANSAVGQAVIQIASAMGLKTINLVRHRPGMDHLKTQLTNLGATHVLTYDEIADKSMRATVKEWTGGKPIKLGLNCVGGKETSMMAGYLGQDGHLVSYGAMSKSPLSLPTSLFIFKNLTSHGYWQSRWYEQHTRLEREDMIKEIIGLVESNNLREPAHEIVSLAGSDDEVNQTLAKTLKTISDGSHGKKFLLKWETQ